MLRYMFVCNECGHGSSIQLGKCPSCSAFGSFARVTGVGKTTKKNKSGHALSAKENQSTVFRSLENKELIRLFPQGIKESASYLLAGEPGIGKSTLMLQLIDDLVSTNPSLKVGYFTAEETTSQIKERYQRIKDELPSGWSLFQTNSCEDIEKTIEEEQFNLVIVDSIQTISSSQSDSASGSPSQVRTCCDILSRTTKKSKTTLILIGHITKGGEIAGPKYLEHIVDAVLYLEGDKDGQYRFLRFKKNRFGHTDEVGIFEMSKTGLLPVYDLKQRILDQLNHSSPGSVLAVSLDNGRPVLVQLEVLVNKMSGKYPQRIVHGIESNRLSLVLAILEKYLSLKLGYFDIFVNIPGEFSFRDNGLDLALAAAIRSQVKNTSIETSLVFIGELGLGGQLLKTKAHSKRLNESKEFTIIDYERLQHISQLANVL